MTVGPRLKLDMVSHICQEDTRLVFDRTAKSGLRQGKLWLVLRLCTKGVDIQMHSPSLSLIKPPDVNDAA